MTADVESVPLDIEGVQRGIQSEREHALAYLEQFEKIGREKADEAQTEESRQYQTTVANTISAIRRALRDEFHWRADR